MVSFFGTCKRYVCMLSNLTIFHAQIKTLFGARFREQTSPILPYTTPTFKQICSTHLSTVESNRNFHLLQRISQRNERMLSLCKVTTFPNIFCDSNQGQWRTRVHAVSSYCDKTLRHMDDWTIG